MKSIVRWLAATLTLVLPLLGPGPRGRLGRFGRQGVHPDAAAQPGAAVGQAEPHRGHGQRRGHRAEPDSDQRPSGLYADEIFVQGGQGGDRVEAKVAAIGPGIDLAVLTLEDETFFAKRPPIPARRSSRRSRRGSRSRASRSAAPVSPPPRERWRASSTTSTRPARRACGSRSTP